MPETDTDQAREGDFLHQLDADPKISRASLKSEQRDVLRVSSELDEFVFSRVAEQFEITDADKFEDFRELLLTVSRDRKENLLTGHCDRLRHYPKRDLIIVIDKKFGRREVEPAAANLQLRAYACGAYEWRPASNIVVAITQPRLEFSRRVTMSNYNVDDLNTSREQLIAIVDGCLSENAPLNVTEIGCRYCTARLICPALKSVLAKGNALVPVNVAGTVALREQQAKDILAKLPDEKLDSVIQFVRFAEFVKDLALEEGRRRVGRNGFPYELGKASEVRKIADSARAISMLQLKGDLTRDEILSCCSPGLGKVEEKLRDKKKLTWKEAKELVNSTLDSVIVLEEKKPSLIRKEAK